ncbi:uncharacterized protein LOC126694886 [Quercus robur]|uniref:uncharacterized protein LOC126694886 n=1 Tax=Quercus robur TaxID=38942 RepID=UPI0021623DCC|nr:uncharacterized protein LOC126694886 [Quercus robur]
MAKNRNKKKRNAADSMDTTEVNVSDIPQAMDTSESVAKISASAAHVKKVKGRPMKRAKNARKMKAIAKAISKNEKCVEKTLKHEGKKLKTQSAKMLYD